MSLSRLFADARPADYPVAIRNAEIITWQTFAGSVANLYYDIVKSSSERWLLSCRDAVEFLVALFAVWHAQRTPVVPINFQKKSLSDASVAADKIISHVKIVSGKHSAGSLSHVVPLSSRLFLQTSGSTGDPKTIEKTLFQLDSEVSTLERQWGKQLKDARVIATVPHYHIYGLLFRLLWPVASGRTFVVEELAMPDDLLSSLRRYSPVTFISSPSHLERLPSLINLTDMVPYVSRIFSSGSPLSPTTAFLYANTLGSAPTEVLGSTETGGIAWREGTAEWTPFPDVEARLGREAALEVRSPRTPAGEWYITGDRAEFSDNNCFKLIGRLDRIVKIEGKRVSLEDIEKKLNAHEWIVRSGVVALEGTRKTLGAAVVPSESGIDKFNKSGRASMITDLKVYLSQWYETVVIPKRWCFVPTLPANEHGKITASELSALFVNAEAEDLRKKQIGK